MSISLTSSGEAEGDMVSAVVVVTDEHGIHIEYEPLSLVFLGREKPHPGILPGHALPLVFVFSASCEQNLN